MNNMILPMRQGATAAILVELYDAGTDMPINLAGLSNWTAKANEEGGTEVYIPQVTVQAAAGGLVKLAGWSADAFTEGLWDLTICARNDADEAVVFPHEGGLLQIEVMV